jgi:hypothetical protein
MANEMPSSKNYQGLSRKVLVVLLRCMSNC